MSHIIVKLTAAVWRVRNVPDSILNVADEQLFGSACVTARSDVILIVAEHLTEGAEQPNVAHESAVLGSRQ